MVGVRTTFRSAKHQENLFFHLQRLQSTSVGENLLDKIENYSTGHSKR